MVRGEDLGAKPTISDSSWHLVNSADHPLVSTWTSLHIFISLKKKNRKIAVV